MPLMCAGGASKTGAAGGDDGVETGGAGASLNENPTGLVGAIGAGGAGEISVGGIGGGGVATSVGSCVVNTGDEGCGVASGAKAGETGSSGVTAKASGSCVNTAVDVGPSLKTGGGGERGVVWVSVKTGGGGGGAASVKTGGGGGDAMPTTDSGIGAGATGGGEDVFDAVVPDAARVSVRDCAFSVARGVPSKMSRTLLCSIDRAGAVETDGDRGGETDGDGGGETDGDGAGEPTSDDTRSKTGSGAWLASTRGGVGTDGSGLLIGLVSGGATGAATAVLGPNSDASTASRALAVSSTTEVAASTSSSYEGT